MSVRTQIEDGIRRYFRAHGFLETPTPVWVENPGMETHIKPFGVTGGGYLQTSPEFAMKQLLVGGLERIFQICPVFRDEPVSSHHHPEFTMLEWYRTHADDRAILADVEALLVCLVGATQLTTLGRTLDLSRPWPRLRVADLFAEHLGCRLGRDDLRTVAARHGLNVRPTDGDADLFYPLWLDFIEPRLPADRPVFVVDYPPYQAALAQVALGADGLPWAQRFEVYAAGMELGNGFVELTDPAVQRERFVTDMDEREREYGAKFPRTPLPGTFLAALEQGMPPAAGIAMGVERLVMLVASEPDIAFTRWLPASR